MQTTLELKQISMNSYVCIPLCYISSMVVTHRVAFLDSNESPKQSKNESGIQDKHIINICIM